MPYIDFITVQPLTPRATKLYLYFLHHLEHTGQPTLAMSLAQLGHHSGLQTHTAWKAPSQRHGHDGAVRKALHELLQHHLIEKRAGQGRQPNTYRLSMPKSPHHNSREETRDDTPTGTARSGKEPHEHENA